MTYIWFLDCGSASVTKVKLSDERNEELDNWLNELNGDVSDWLSKYEDKWGINLNTCSWMISESDEVYEVDF